MTHFEPVKVNYEAVDDPRSTTATNDYQKTPGYLGFDDPDVVWNPLIPYDDETDGTDVDNVYDSIGDAGDDLRLDFGSGKRTRTFLK